MKKHKIKRYLKFNKDQGINVFREAYRQWNYFKFFITLLIFYIVFNIFSEGYLINNDIELFVTVSAKIFTNSIISLFFIYLFMIINIYIDNYKKVNLFLDNYKKIKKGYKDIGIGHEWRGKIYCMFYGKVYEIIGADLTKINEKKVRGYKLNAILDKL
jgi:hypothetical protein